MTLIWVSNPSPMQIFDHPASALLLHDLNRDGQLDVSEVRGLYGLPDTWSESSPHSESTIRRVTSTVMDLLDKNGDGLVSLEEFQSEELPEFPGVEGHHYSEEEEYFIHHEEKHHMESEDGSVPAFDHPEDIAHFQSHEAEHDDDPEEQHESDSSSEGYIDVVPPPAAPSHDDHGSPQQLSEADLQSQAAEQNKKQQIAYTFPPLTQEQIYERVPPKFRAKKGWFF